MKRITILTHGFHHDRRTGATFQEQVMKNPDPDAHKDSKVRLGVAEDVDPAMVREFYLGHKNYRVEGYSDEELYPDGVPEEVMAAREAQEEAEKAKPLQEDPADPEEDQEPGEPEEGTPAAETNPLAGVDFASDNAGEAAATFGLSAEDFADMLPSGSKGEYTVKDVRKANKARKV